jgi:hypothetical protein
MDAVQTRFLEGADYSFAVSRTQDVEPIANFTQGMAALEQGNGKDVKYAAEIPNVIVEQYISRKGITFAQFCESQEHIKEIVNDPALKAFRVWQGRV